MFLIEKAWSYISNQFFKALKNELTSDNIKLNNSAHQKLATENPVIRLSTSKIMSALMTNVKSPKVRIVTGSVNIMRIGLRMVFTIPKTTATITAVRNESTVTPGSKYAVIKTASELIKRLIINSIK